uniref:Uncharacterized protein n=1 Tax=Ditylenchus dipsaci TaxID=166011 RepID=A0A915E1L7_9BILA
MNEFSWSNSDVVVILQKLRSKQITFGFVEQFLKQEYNQKKSKTAIYRQMGLIQLLDVFLLDADIIPFQSKFGNKIMAVKEKNRFRVYKKRSEALFGFFPSAKEDKRPKPLPFLLKKDNRFFLNNGVHIAHCRLRELNELVARDIDRCAREEVEHNPHMKPQFRWFHCLPKQKSAVKSPKRAMKFLSDHRKEKWTRWVCPEDEVDDYIELHQSSPSEISAERKNWGCSSELILAARLYDRNFVLYQPDERWKFLNFSAKYESVRTPLVDGRETALLRYRMNHFDVVVENV